MSFRRPNSPEPHEIIIYIIFVVALILDGIEFIWMKLNNFLF